MLKNINPHFRDRRITPLPSDEEHGYLIDGKNRTDYISVTTYVGEVLFEKFDPDKVIEKLKSSDNWKRSKYYGKTNEEIKEIWDKAAKDGTAMHEEIERKLNNANRLSDFNFEAKRFDLFLENHPELTPFRTEWCVFDEDIKICGCIDVVFTTGDPKNPKYVMYDWKRTKSLWYRSKFGKGKTDSMKDTDDCNYSRYRAQLNIYALILERKYDIIIDTMRILCIHPEMSLRDRPYLERIVYRFSSDKLNVLVSERLKMTLSFDENKNDNDDDHNK